MMGYGIGLGMGLGGWLWMVGFVLLVAGVVVLVAWLGGRGAAAAEPSVPGPAGPAALEILRSRFARGEISRDEYLAAKQTLEADR